MIILMVLAAAVAAVDILLLLPVHLGVRYGSGAFSLMVRTGPVPVKRVSWPGAADAGAGRDTPRAGALRRIPPAVLCRAARRCWVRLRKTVRRVRLDLLSAQFTAGGDDPCRAALAYAGVGAAMEGIQALAAGRARRVALSARADLDGGPTAFDGRVDLTARLGTVLGAAVCFGTALLREYSLYQRGRE